MIKQLAVTLALAAAANASFMYVLMTKDLGYAFHTKAFLAGQGIPTEWSAGATVHATTASGMSTDFSNIKTYYNKANGQVSINYKGSDWGVYQTAVFKSENFGNLIYYYVCHNDSNNPNFCTTDSVNYYGNFAVDHIN